MASPRTLKSRTSADMFVEKLQELVDKSMTRLVEPLQAAFDAQEARVWSLEVTVATQQAKIETLEKMIAACESKLEQDPKEENNIAPESDHLLEDCVISVCVRDNAKGFSGLVNGVPARFWMSTGSTHSFINADVAARAGMPFVSRIPMICSERFGGNQYRTKGTVEAVCSIQDTYECTLLLEVLEELKSFDVVLGSNWLHRVGSVQFLADPNRVSFSYQNRMVTLTYEYGQNEEETQGNQLNGAPSQRIEENSILSVLGAEDEEEDTDKDDNDDEEDDGDDYEDAYEDQQDLETCTISVLVSGEVKGFRGTVNGILATFLFSSGSTHSFINADVAARAELAFVSRTPKLCEMRYGGYHYRTEGTVEAVFTIQDTYRSIFPFEVLKELKTHDVVLGNDWAYEVGDMQFLGRPSRLSFLHQNQMVTLTYESLGNVAGEQDSEENPQNDGQNSASCVLVTDNAKGYKIQGQVSDVPASFFISQDSTHSFIKSEFARRAGLTYVAGAPKICEMPDVGGTHRTEGRVQASVTIQKYGATLQFEVLEQLSAFDVVLGSDWTSGLKELLLSGRRVSFRHQGRMVTLKCQGNGPN